ncbi:LacI family DNA-binding transcriptional regulator [Roseomonas terrae]|jgi:LacI family gluconate utilization system Gnt-I transcriptional repressor|uniref:LacI family DNA-binding transcriptional regulator n=2 Tax=Neoroseomonas terrae TaxID=424799 RepID=A0ABS5EGL3_9PROT|nr:LacI family DNA-binding transcriptional regulator [Neoroseomonas terrae]
MTVSRALREPDAVSSRVREKVATAVRDLGYLPNRFAGGLAARRSRLVTVIVSGISASVYADALRGADEVLRPLGYEVLISQLTETPEQEERAVAALLGWQPEGVILSGIERTDATRRMLHAAGVPVVEALELTDTPIDSNVGLDHRSAGIAMGRHLADRGYRRIAFYGARLDSDFRAFRRLEGLRAGLAECGLVPVRVVCSEAPSTPETGARFLRELLDDAAAPDAVFLSNDTIAMGALFEAQRLGVAVPERIAIAGFGGSDITAAINPPLTTIRFARREMGRRAALTLLDRIERRAPPGQRVDVGFELLARGTT